VDREEPPHVHVERDRKRAKFWLTPISLAWQRRFSAHELRRIDALIDEHYETLMEAWYEYFDR